jgi:hypothetical protein
MKKILYATMISALLCVPNVYSVCNEVVLVREFESSLSGKNCLALYWCDGRKVKRCWALDTVIEKTVLNKPMGTVTVTYRKPSNKRTLFCDDTERVDIKICRLWRTYKKTINRTEIEEEQGYVDVEAELEAAPKEYYK